jgi:hypothetical protein
MRLSARCAQCFRYLFLVVSWWDVGKSWHYVIQGRIWHYTKSRLSSINYLDYRMSTKSSINTVFGRAHPIYSHFANYIRAFTWTNHLHLINPSFHLVFSRYLGILWIDAISLKVQNSKNVSSDYLLIQPAYLKRDRSFARSRAMSVFFGRK